MQLHLIAVGKRMPGWVEQGYATYAKRMPASTRLHLSEIAPAKRTRGADTARAVVQEGERMLAAIPKGAYVIALEVDGRAWSTPQLAEELARWRQGGRDIALLVGGPEGLCAECRARAEASWSLSPLTLPHPLVRVLLAEQLYRACSILDNHPYHRGA